MNDTTRWALLVVFTAAVCLAGGWVGGHRSADRPAPVTFTSGRDCQIQLYAAPNRWTFDCEASR